MPKLHSQQLITSTPMLSEVAAHRIMIIDCSGSMSRELSNIRSELKAKIPQLTSVGDRISIIWFSSKGQAGILQEAVEIRKVSDFTNINSAIDKWLRPMGATGFVDPLVLANGIIDRLSKFDGKHVLYFLTDGQDNCSTRPAILSAVESVNADSFVFVEYGYYADRNLLTQMAERVGGALVFNKEFSDFQETLSSALTKKTTGGVKRQVKLDLTTYPDLSYAFYLDGADVVSVDASSGEVTVPESVTSITYMTTSGKDLDEDSLYLAAYTTAQRMKGAETIDLLGATGDKYFIEKFCNCFSKQDYSDFQKELLEVINDKSKRFSSGKDFNCVPAEDAYTVIDLLNELASHGDNKFHPFDDNFSYDRIGAKRDQKNAKISPEELAELQKELAAAKTPEDLKAVQAKLDEVAESKFKIEFEPNDKAAGYTVDVTFNGERPNINILFRAQGYVVLPKNEHNLPTEFGTHIYRNYTMVKDAIKHTALSNLPFELAEKSFMILQDNGLLVGETWEAGKIYYIDAKVLPVINRKMTAEVSAKEFFETSVKLNYLKSVQKVFNTEYKNVVPATAKSTGFLDMYGAEATLWLKSIGVSEFNGFNPPSTTAETTDEYMALFFEDKIAKCSSIPTINAKLVEKVLKTPKTLTLSEQLCAGAILEIEEFKAHVDYVSLPEHERVQVYTAWLSDQKERSVAEVRKLILAMAKTKYAILVGHIWFKEFSSMDENSMEVTVDIDGTPTKFSCEAVVRENPVKL